MFQNMSNANNCYDNAIHGIVLRYAKNGAGTDWVRRSVEGVPELSVYMNYYNLDRRHSSLGYLISAEVGAQPTLPC